MAKPSNSLFSIRRADANDAELVARQRAWMFQEMGRIRAEEVPGFVTAATPVLQQFLRDEQYCAWFAEADGQVIGGAGVLLRPLLPRPDALHGPEAVVLNVYVDCAHRRRGVAHLLMKTILEWCRVKQIARIVLHPSAMGQPLYERLGFVPTGELVYRPAQ